MGTLAEDQGYLLSLMHDPRQLDERQGLRERLTQVDEAVRVLQKMKLGGRWHR